MFESNEERKEKGLKGTTRHNCISTALDAREMKLVDKYLKDHNYMFLSEFIRKAIGEFLIAEGVIK